MTVDNHQVAVVTGASAGIGKEIALQLAAQGMSVCLVGRSLSTLQRVAQQSRSKAAATRCYRADLSVKGDVEELIACIKRDVEAVDVLVHAAAFFSLGPLESATADQFDSHYKTNVRAPYVLTQGLLPQLKSRQGQVLFVNSTAGLTARANVSQYSASKHALKALADSLREEVNPAGMRVLSLFLGRMATAMQAEVHALEGREYQPELLMQPEDVATVALQALASPRSMEITEINMRPRVKSY